jgi:hypothetical protein
MTGAFLDGGARVPAPPAGYGALVVTYWFDSAVDLVRDGVVVDDQPNWDTWIEPPVVQLDGVPVAASWARWWYPLPSGPHEIEVTGPVPAAGRVEVDEGAVVSLAYRANLRLRKDFATGALLDRGGTASVRRR